MRKLIHIFTTGLIVVLLFNGNSTLTPSTAAATLNTPQDYNGLWRGLFETDAFTVEMNLNLTQEAKVWLAKVKFKQGEREEAPTVHNLRVQDIEIAFAVTLAGTEIKFVGKLSGNLLNGTAEGFRNGSKVGAGKWQLTRATSNVVPQSTPDNNKSISGSSDEAEREAVKQVVQHYVDVTDKKDFESIKLAFHPEAKLMSVGTSGLKQLTLNEWWDRVSRIPGKVERRSRISVIEVTGLAAIAKVEFDRSTDYMTLLKVNGEWRIVNKILSTSL